MFETRQGSGDEDSHVTSGETESRLRCGSLQSTRGTGGTVLGYVSLEGALGEAGKVQGFELGGQGGTFGLDPLGSMG